MAVAVPGQQPEVTAEQMAAQSENVPARARRRLLPVRRPQAREQVIQPVPLDGEQGGVVVRRFGGRR